MIKSLISKHRKYSKIEEKWDLGGDENEQKNKNKRSAQFHKKNIQREILVDNFQKLCGFDLDN